MEHSAFYHSATKEPHQTRRAQILRKYPEARKLMGPNPWSMIMVVALVAVQTFFAAGLAKLPLWAIVACAWIFGAVINHALLVLIHEGTHNLIFKSTWANRAAAVVANFCIGIPMAMAFRRFHLLHHQHQGDPKRDADLPTVKEARLVGNSSFRKAIWLLTFVFIDAFYRPRAVREGKVPVRWIIINYAAEIVYCAGLIYYFGPKAYLYLVVATLFSVGLHPLGARWIQEHFVVKRGQETYSYYGPFNNVMFNVGFHNEHHDLPYVAWNRLPRVRKMAPEMYDTLHFHTSYWALLNQFIFDPSIGMFSRVVRAGIQDHPNSDILSAICDGKSPKRDVSAALENLGKNI